MKTVTQQIGWLCAAVLIASQAVAGQLVTRSYSVERSFMDAVMPHENRGTNDTSTVTDGTPSLGDRDIREFFRAAGLTITSEGHFAYMTSSSELQLTGTEAEHALLEEMLNQMGTVDHQVEVIVSLLRGSADTYRMGTNTLLRDVQSLPRAPSNGFSVVSTITGLARSGVNSEVSAVGTTLNFTPTIGPDAKTIDLTLAWSGSTNEPNARAIATSVAIHNQCTLVLQAYQTSNAVELVTLSANIVTLDGKIYRRTGADN